MSDAALTLGIAGLGTVGSGVAALLERHADLYRRRCGKTLALKTVCARDKDKDRPFDSNGMDWASDPMELASDAEIDVVIEAIGGATGVALDLCRAALQNGKHVVTANKAMIAENGGELAALAEKHNVVLAFEAAVAGGIPTIKTLRESLAANSFTRISGLLNGTCNYILSEMERGAGDFATALAGAQELGYAEADPSADVDGLDAAHKLAILSATAFGGPPSMEGVSVSGIRNVTPRDFAVAKEFGKTIRLTASASLDASGCVTRAVYPALTSLDSDMAKATGAENVIVIEGDAVGCVSLKGPGAGMYETASSIIGDVLDIARGYRFAAFTPCDDAPEAVSAPQNTSKYFLCAPAAIHDDLWANADVAVEEYKNVNIAGQNLGAGVTLPTSGKDLCDKIRRAYPNFDKKDVIMYKVDG